tara:strand:+ start:272 stop:955 length:684 start_codon:yes stop_codon:yes gene_type:complete
MSLNNKIKLKYQKIIRYKAWLLCLLSATLILSCTDDIDNGGAALLGPSFGLSVIPQNTTILKAGAQIFTATGGVAPYTFYIANTSKGTSLGTMVPATGVFTGVEALAAAPAGTATVTAVDSTGVTGTTTITVLPTILIATPGSGIITEPGDLAITATLLSGSALITCSVSRDDSSGTTTIPTVAVAAAICTVTASAVPASGTEDFTVTLTDSINGDYATAKVTLGTP